MFTEKVNLGVNALWEVAYKDFKPYEDRLRSTNAKDFVRDTILDRKEEPFKKDSSVPENKFVPDKKPGS